MKNQLLQKRHRLSGHARDIGARTSYVPKGIIPCSLAGCGIAFALAILLAFIMAAVIYRTADPARYVAPAAFSALYISAFIGGVSASSLNRGSALLCGGLCGIMLLVLAFLLSLFIGSEAAAEYSLIEGILLRSAVIVCSVFGAFIGTTKKISKNKKRKNHKKR